MMLLQYTPLGRFKANGFWPSPSPACQLTGMEVGCLGEAGGPNLGANGLQQDTSIPLELPPTVCRIIHHRIQMV